MSAPSLACSFTAHALRCRLSVKVSNTQKITTRSLRVTIVIRIFGIYTHAQLERNFWDAVSKHISGRGKEYRKRYAVFSHCPGFPLIYVTQMHLPDEACKRARQGLCSRDVPPEQRHGCPKLADKPSDSASRGATRGR